MAEHREPTAPSVAEARAVIEDCWGALNFILAFYEPGQRYLDTNAWKQAEASGRRAHAAARAWLDAAPPTGLVGLGEGSNTDPQPTTTSAPPPSPPAVVDYTERAKAMLDDIVWLFSCGTNKPAISTEVERKLKQDIAAALSAVASEHQAAPIPMVLFCPSCGVQHIDKTNWDSPPHRTHQCQGCGHLWRPASVYTEGVADVPLGTSDVRPAIRGQARPEIEALKHEAAGHSEALAKLAEPEMREAVKRALERYFPGPGNKPTLHVASGAALAVITEKLNG